NLTDPHIRMKIRTALTALIFLHAISALAEESQTENKPMPEHHHVPGMNMSAPTDVQTGTDQSASTNHQHDQHDMDAMQGAYGVYTSAREASGTSWQPDSSPHEGIHQMYGDW